MLQIPRQRRRPSNIFPSDELRSSHNFQTEEPQSIFNLIDEYIEGAAPVISAAMETQRVQPDTLPAPVVDVQDSSDGDDDVHDLRADLAHASLARGQEKEQKVRMKELGKVFIQHSSSAEFVFPLLRLMASSFRSNGETDSAFEECWMNTLPNSFVLTFCSLSCLLARLAWAEINLRVMDIVVTVA